MDDLDVLLGSETGGCAPVSATSPLDATGTRQVLPGWIYLTGATDPATKLPDAPALT
jgi:hypothetical protein